MLVMLSTVIAVGMAGIDVPLTYTDRSLNQNELTFNNTVAIVDVEDQKVVEAKRATSSRNGTIEPMVWTQSVRMIDSNGDKDTISTLAFHEHLQYRNAGTAGTPMSQASLPLKPGRYLVIGRLPQNGDLTILSSVPGYGTPSDSAPPVAVLKQKQVPTTELSVFAVFPTQSSSVVKGVSPKDLLLAIVEGIDPSDQSSVNTATRLLVQTKHNLPEWAVNATPAAKRLGELADGAQVSQSARMLLTAVNLGSYALADKALLKISEASGSESSLWAGAEYKNLLQQTNLYPMHQDEALRRQLSDPKRQGVLLRAAVDAKGSAVREFVLRHMSSTPFNASKRDLAKLLDGAEQDQEYAKVVMNRLSLWLNQPGKDPFKSTKPIAEQIADWKQILRDNP